MSCAPVPHGVLLLIHHPVASRNGHAGWDNEDNDPRAEGGSMPYKHAGQHVVLAKGRVQPNDQPVTNRQISCSVHPGLFQSRCHPCQHTLLVLQEN